MNFDRIEKYAPAVLKLLRGVLSIDDGEAWERLLTDQVQVRQYFEKIGLELFLHEPDGYAFIRQPDTDNDGQPLGLPRLTRRTSLTFGQTLLCVLLREKLDDFDTSMQDSPYLILSVNDIYQMMQPFLKQRSDERKLEDQVKRNITRITELGFLRRLPDSDEYIVQRVIKSRVDSERLTELKAKLNAYVGADEDITSDADELE